MALSPATPILGTAAEVSSDLGLDFWGVPLACLALTVGYLIWMVIADRRAAALDGKSGDRS